MDMDGLLLDSETTYCGAWRHAALEVGLDLDEAFLQTLFGRHADDVVTALTEAAGPDFDQKTFFGLAERHWLRLISEEGIPQMPGVSQLLNLLKNQSIPYALATNSEGQYAKVCIELGGLVGAFDVIVTRDQVAHGKPKPDVFLEAARRLQVAPENCLVLEDSRTGLLAARAAGTHPILVQRSDALRESLRPHAAMALSSLLELAELIDAALPSAGLQGH